MRTERTWQLPLKYSPSAIFFVSVKVNMHSIFPIDEVRPHFSSRLQFRQFGLEEYAQIVRFEAQGIGNVGATVWNRMVHAKVHDVDPKALQKYFKQDGKIDPEIVFAIGEIIGEPVIKDISYSRCTIDAQPVAELLLADVYPNDLHWADVHFRDPRRPIRRPPSATVETLRKFKGFGLLGAVVSSIDQYARENGFDYVTLTAAEPSLVPLFESYGFELERNDLAKFLRAMEKRIKE
jgi:hypothetical protein